MELYNDYFLILLTARLSLHFVSEIKIIEALVPWRYLTIVKTVVRPPLCKSFMRNQAFKKSLTILNGEVII
jgi:hypothetical protein